MDKIGLDQAEEGWKVDWSKCAQSNIWAIASHASPDTTAAKNLQWVHLKQTSFNVQGDRYNPLRKQWK
jgi:hypothetical protein